MLIIPTWYRFFERGGKKWVAFDGKLIPKRDVILESFSAQFRTQIPWETKDIGNKTEKGGVCNTVRDALKM